MTDFIFIYILLVHYFADFIMQTHMEAINKSTSTFWLLRHTSKYALIWFLFAVLFTGYNNPSNQTPSVFYCTMLFAIITFVAHTITDYFTSKLSKKYFSKQDYHNGFLVVGFDQVLHYIQLWYTFKLLL